MGGATPIATVGEATMMQRMVDHVVFVTPRLSKQLEDRMSLRMLQFCLRSTADSRVQLIIRGVLEVLSSAIRSLLEGGVSAIDSHSRAPPCARVSSLREGFTRGVTIVLADDTGRPITNEFSAARLVASSLLAPTIEAASVSRSRSNVTIATQSARE